VYLVATFLCSLAWGSANNLLEITGKICKFDFFLLDWQITIIYIITFQLKMDKKSILLLTLVHPDFLPPVYAVAQVLRDQGYNIRILTFDSFVPAELNLGGNIELESVGKHYDVNTIERIRLRNKFMKRARQLSYENPTAIISFCPFSFNCGIKIKNKVPLIYIALEVSDFVFHDFLRSPLSFYRNLRTFQNIDKANLIATPSIQRSAWLAGRCQLSIMPYTILNTSYLSDQDTENSFETFKELVPQDFLNKKILLYTGAVNSQQCTLELVQGFDLANDPESALIITGIKDNDYCNEIREIAEKSNARERILLFPYLPRRQMLSLQSNADIGVYLSKEYFNKIQSKMIAPNKVGEYMGKGLYLLGINNEYLRPFEMKGIASLATSPKPHDISIAIKNALHAVNKKDYKIKIKEFVLDYFCMQKQLVPVIQFLNKL